MLAALGSIEMAQWELARRLCGRAQIKTLCADALFFFLPAHSPFQYSAHRSHVCWSMIKNKKTIQRLNFKILSICFRFTHFNCGLCRLLNVLYWCVFILVIQALIPLRNVVRFYFFFCATFFMNRFSAIQSSICQLLAKWNPNLRQIKINIKLKHLIRWRTEQITAAAAFVTRISMAVGNERTWNRWTKLRIDEILLTETEHMNYYNSLNARMCYALSQQSHSSADAS